MVEVNQLLSELILELREHNDCIIKTVDISLLPSTARRGLDKAILVAIPLIPEFEKLTPNDHHVKEVQTDMIAEKTASKLIQMGYKAFAQTLNNVFFDKNVFDDKNISSPLPNKTIAVLSGIGWIGKNALLVTKDYGCALSICAILTNAPLNIDDASPMVSLCGECMICKDICHKNIIHGRTWEKGISRDELIDVRTCDECFRCFAECPWTKKYIKSFTP